jgi:tRNA pseudouridine55 synthase
VTLGFLVVDKPGGITSNAVVSRVKKATGVRKVGHAGTLDPMATGAVVVAIGAVTRLIKYIQDQPKEYHAVAEFGVATDSLDADGSVLSREPMDISVDDLNGIRDRFVGPIHQVPPMVSALKHNGRRLYELAREGVVIEREAREVRIDELEFLDVGPGPYPKVEFRVVCGKGTYVRSLADDMAGALGGAAHLTSLRRNRIGSLSIEEHGIPADSLDGWEQSLISPSDALVDLPSVFVDDETASAVGNGVQFVGGAMTEVPESVPVRILNSLGELIAVYSRQGDTCSAEVVIPPS